MGYTHFWEHTGIDADRWSALARDARRIIEASDVPLGDAEGYGQPEIDDNAIALNGRAELGDDCETFALIPEPVHFAFCKTYARPYDLVVTAILLRASAAVPGFIVRSDGTWDDWQEGRALYVQVFGEEPPRPIELAD